MAIKSFADQTTSDIYHGLDTKAARRINKQVWPHARRRLTLLHTTSTTLELAQNGGLHFKALKYDRPGYNSIRINDQDRILFTFQNGDASNVGIEDFHGRGQT